MKLTVKSKAVDLIGVTIAVSGVSLVRSWNALDRLPPDPGIDFYEEAWRDGIRVLFREEGGYLDVPRRVFSLLISGLAPEYWVTASNILWLGIEVVVSLLIYRSVIGVTSSRVVSLLASLTYALSPAASESQLGHDSVVKWSLFVATAVTLADRRRLEKSAGLVITLLVLTCLSNPLSFVLLVPLLLQNVYLLRRRNFYSLLNLAMLLGLSLVQLLVWRISTQGVQKYGDATVYRPWDGMGGFWLFNWLSAPLFAVLMLCWDALSSRAKSGIALNDQPHFRMRLNLLALTLWTCSYLLGGIGDRYFVVPQTLVWISALTMIAGVSATRVKWYQALGLVISLIFFAGALRWFTASPFLTASSKWSSSVEIARLQCSANDEEVASIEQSLNTVELPCRLLR
jgi:hypothetical protein